MENKFDTALKRNELVDFFLGKGEYFIYDRDYGEHSVIVAWTSHICPYLDNKGDVDMVGEMFLATLEDRTLNLYTKEMFLTNHLFVYYSLVQEHRVPSLKDEGKIERLAQLFYRDFYKEMLVSKKEYSDTFIRAMSLIKKRGGPDYIAPLTGM